MFGAFMKTARRNLSVAALGLLLFILPAQAATSSSVPGKTANVVNVLGQLQTQLNTITPISPLRDLAAQFWQTYSGPQLAPSKALAGSILLETIKRPETLPDLAAALRNNIPARNAQLSRKVAGQLHVLSTKCQDAPQDLQALQNLLAPLRKNLSRNAPLREAPGKFKPLLDALFDNSSSRNSAQIRTPPFENHTRPSSLREVMKQGAGTRGFGLKAGEGGVQPIDRLSGTGLTHLTSALKKADTARSPNPRILSENELEILHPGRTAYSNTISRDETKKQANKNFSSAAKFVNDKVRQGKNLELGMLMDLNRILRHNLSSWEWDGAPEPGKVRIWNHEEMAQTQQGKRFEYTKPKHVFNYLADFLVWYQANKDRLHPIHLAAAAYQQLVRIHPFGEGNGRTTRLIMDFILQRNGYLPPIFNRHASAEAVHSTTAEVILNTVQGIRDAKKELRGL